MLRRVLHGSALLLLLIVVLAGTAKRADAARRRFLRIRYVGSFRYVRIYIEDDFRGKIYRDQQRSFYLRAGRSYVVKARYGHRVHRRTVYIPRHRSRTIVLRRPTKNVNYDERGNEGGRRYRYIIIRYQGTKPYARLSINGRRRGRIYRDSSRRFRARTGRWYRIRLKYGYRKRTKRVFLTRDRNRRVTFFSP